MNGLPYYKRYPRDLIEGTQGMPFELKVTYSFVLDLIYVQSGYLPDDPRYIAGVLGVSVRKWRALRDGLIEAGKLKAEGGKLTNYRALSELESLSKFQDKQRENRSHPNKNNNLRSPRSHHTESESYTPQTPRDGGPIFDEGLREKVMAQRADAIRRKAPWVRHHLSPNMARELVAAGKVTEKECEEAGVL